MKLISRISIWSQISSQISGSGAFWPQSSFPLKGSEKSQVGNFKRQTLAWEWFLWKVSSAKRYILNLESLNLGKMWNLQNQEDLNHRNFVSKCASACGVVWGHREITNWKYTETSIAFHHCSGRFPCQLGLSYFSFIFVLKMMKKWRNTDLYCFIMQKRLTILPIFCTNNFCESWSGKKIGIGGSFGWRH